MFIEKNINFIKFFPFAIIYCILIIIGCFITLIFFNINWGIDFIGGTEIHIKFKETKISSSTLIKCLEEKNIKHIQVQTYGNQNNSEYLIKTSKIKYNVNDKINNLSLKIKNEFNIDDTLKEFYFIKKMNNLGLYKISLPFRINELNAFDLNKKQYILEKTKIKIKDIIKINKIDLLSETEKNIYNKINKKLFICSYTFSIPNTNQLIINILHDLFPDVEIMRYDVVDSYISKQVKYDGISAIIYTLLAILIYISYRFNFLFAPGAIVALLHDICGIFLIILIFQYEFNLSALASILTIIGYSVNNTIVIYDRIRTFNNNNFLQITTNINDNFNNIKKDINTALNKTLMRSINTSLTTIFASLSLVIFGGQILESFSIIITTGIILGAFSSIFIAPNIYLLLCKFFPFYIIKNSQPKHIYTKKELDEGII